MTEEYLSWEVVVVGGGPAGMTAAIYAARYGLKTILLESKVLGGAQATSPGIENYPGFTFISGLELATKMKEQVKATGAKVREITEVKSITREGEDGDFLLETRRGIYRGKAVIFATGGGHRHLNVPGESEFTGRGVSYCATCDGPLFRDKKVLVIGGGNTAAVESAYLSELTEKTTLVHRRDELRAEKAMQDMVFRSPVEIKWSHIVKEFKGGDLLNEVVLENIKTGELSSVEVDGAFVALGSSPESKLAIDLGIETNKNGEILVNANQTTSIPGFFAAGDVVESMKQIAVAVGHGAIAADSAYIYIRELQRTDPRGYGG
ncbi:MAG: FAD-dependent oxidoreductase [Candidatus Thorarchaeota archaeon]|nr:FAD-dependent oxidoreductase [Candidatus Thorarchaeota archaeon]